MIRAAFPTSLKVSKVYLDGGGADQSDDLVDPSDHVYKARIVVFKPAPVHDGGDDVGGCVVGQAGRVKGFSCGVDTGSAWNMSPNTRTSSPLGLSTPVPWCSSNFWIKYRHSSAILFSIDLLPMPKSLRVLSAKRLISFHVSPFANRIPGK